MIIDRKKVLPIVRYVYPSPALIRDNLQLGISTPGGNTRLGNRSE